jgi:dolichol-phosphate mannosyltransferase
MITAAQPSVLVVIPTYNEIDNLETVVRRVLAAVPGAHVLVVDDGSPDGTGRLAEQLHARDPRIDVLHRATKDGLAAAYLAGFAWGLERSFEAVVEMDADGSHAPEELPRLLAALETADAVLGSRYVAGGRVRNWPRRRQLLSRAGNLYVRVALGTRLRDATGGYRAYRRAVLEQVLARAVTSTGYCFQIDVARRAEQAGFTVVEVPITFTDRLLGESKMRGSIVVEALGQSTRWGVQHRLQQAGQWRTGGEPARHAAVPQPAAR